MVAVMEDGALGIYLEEKGIQAQVFSPEATPSLTALLAAHPEISDVVLPETQYKNWSLGHILAAAKQLQAHGGRMILLGEKTSLPPLIRVVRDKQELIDLLQKPAAVSGSTGTASGSTDTTSGGMQPPRKEIPVPRIRPLEVPPGKLLFLGVVGSQHRIGCTTQAVGLWHYCKALGFDPAVVCGADQLAQLAAPMDSRQISGGYQIEGIPFVVDTAQSYDCYILDLGTGSLPEAARISDCLVLVAGAKPWELSNTLAAIRSAGRGEVAVLLSFTTKTEGAALAPLFGSRAAAVLPWMPQLWQPSPAAMAIYDALLRPQISRALARQPQTPEQEEENENELKEEP